MSAVYCVEKLVTPSGSVQFDSGRTAPPAAAGTAFQLPTMASTATVASTGRDSGSRIRQKKPNGPQPSIGAASSSSVGMLRKNGRRMMIVSGSPNAAWGRATPSGLSSSPRSRTRMNSGRIATATGNSRPEREQRVQRPRGPGRRSGRRRTPPAPRTGRPATVDEPRDQHAVAELAPERRRRRGSRCSWRRPTGSAAPTGSVASCAGVLEAAEDRVDDRHDDDRATSQQDDVAHDRRAVDAAGWRRDRRRAATPARAGRWSSAVRHRSLASGGHGALDVAPQDEALVGQREDQAR